MIVGAISALLAGQAVPARPVESYGSWISDADYPAAALRRRESGTTEFTLTVDSEGKPTGCNIDRTSRSEALDAATCDLMLARVHFTPGRDAAGNVTASTFKSRIRWVLPGSVPATPEAWRPDMAKQLKIETIYGADGALVGCKVLAARNRADAARVCERAPPRAVVRTVDGKPVSYREVTTVTTEYEH